MLNSPAGILQKAASCHGREALRTFRYAIADPGPRLIVELPDRVQRLRGVGHASLEFFVFVFAHLESLSNRYVINDDVQQQVFWMQKWHEAGLYEEYLPADYAKRYVTWGARGIYRIASFFVDPILFSKLLTGILYVLLVVFAYMVGCSILDRRLGWTVVCVAWLMPIFLMRISGGLARSFAMPLLAFYCYAWLR